MAVNTTASGDYFATVILTLTALGKTAVGVGCDVASKDPDKAVKTALAEAIKKAGHQFGVALYLWDEGKRKEIEKFRALQQSSLSSLQSEVVKRSGLSKDLLTKKYGNNLKTKEGLLEILDELPTGS